MGTSEPVALRFGARSVTATSLIDTEKPLTQWGLPKKFAPLLLALALLVGGCGRQKVNGTYRNMESQRKSLELTAGGKAVLMPSGDTSDFTVEGEKIVVTHVLFGGVFPAAKKDNFVGSAFAGTWKRE